MLLRRNSQQQEVTPTPVDSSRFYKLAKTPLPSEDPSPKRRSAKNFIPKSPTPPVPKTELDHTKDVGKVVIGKGVALSGDIVECESVVIAGAFSGRVEANTVVLQYGCTFKGAIVAERLTVGGFIDASTVICTQHLTLRSTCEGSVGSLEYNTMDMEPSARISGKLIHSPNLTFSNIVTLKDSEHPSQPESCI